MTELGCLFPHSPPTRLDWVGQRKIKCIGSQCSLKSDSSEDPWWNIRRQNSTKGGEDVGFSKTKCSLITSHDSS